MREEGNNRQKVKDKNGLQGLLRLYLSRAWVIALCVVVFAGVALVYTKLFVTPMYRTDVTLYVNHTTGSEHVEEVDSTASQKLVETYVTIIKSDRVLEEVVEKGGFDYSVSQLRNMIQAGQVESTEVFTVCVVNPDPVMATKIANTIAEVAPAEIASIIEGSSVKIIDYAKVPTAPFAPNYANNTLIGGLLGLVFGFVCLTIRYLMDVRTRKKHRSQNSLGEEQKKKQKGLFLVGLAAAVVLIVCLVLLIARR